MRYLKQSTSVDLPIGPFLDSTDGVTAETGLTLTQPDIRLKKNGGSWAQKAAAQTLSHEENGWYEVTLDATDTDTLGQLMLAVHESGALPVWHEFTVLAANVYDSLVAASDNLQVDAIQIEGSDPTDTINAEVDTAIADARLDELLAADSDIDGAAPPAVGSVFHELMSKSTGSFTFDQTTDSNEAIRDKAADIETDTQDIQGRLPAALTGAGNIKADALAIDGSTEGADRLAEGAKAIVKFVCDSGGSTTSVVFSSLDPASSVNDQLNGKIITFAHDTTTAALRGQSTDITDYVHSTLTATVTALTSTPASGDYGVVT